MRAHKDAQQYYQCAADWNEDAASLRAEAAKAMASGQYQRAIELFTEQISIHPEDYQSLCGRSKAFCAIRQYRSAATDARSATNIAPDWFPGMIQYANILRDQRKMWEAKRAYRAALKHLPEGIQGLKHKELITKAMEKVHYAHFSECISSNKKFAHQSLGPKLQKIRNGAAMLHPVREARALYHPEGKYYTA